MTEEAQPTIKTTQTPFEVTIPSNGKHTIKPEDHQGKDIFVMQAELLNQEIKADVIVYLEYDEIEESTEKLVHKDIEIIKFTTSDKETKELNLCCDDVGEYIFKVNGDSDVLISGIYSLPGTSDDDDDAESEGNENKEEEDKKEE